MDDFENVLNNIDARNDKELEYKKIAEYNITFAKIIKTKFGNSLFIILNDEIGIWLPKRFSKLNVKQIKALTNYTIIYQGSNDRSKDKFKPADNIKFKIESYSNSESENELID